MFLPSRRFTASTLLLLLIPTAALGCLWDYDTIKMERTRFPGTLELITGKFLRHSPEFYRWRIENRLKRLESDPSNATLLDDLAVAYDKTGQHDKAIEIALRTEKLHPGRYETSSNLSTLYFHAGKFQEARAPIDRALAINSNAHFGREKYQKLLLEYVIKQCPAGKLKYPLATLFVSGKLREDPFPDTVHASETFADYLWPKNATEQIRLEDASAAVKAVQGMMKFANHDSPVLLEALGTLLGHGAMKYEDDAKLLAARAYLKASYESGDDASARLSYRAMAANVIPWQSPRSDNPEPVTLENIEKDFRKELDEGGTWYAELREKELSWIREGKDPEAEFDKLYDLEPEVSGMDVKDPMTPPERIRLFMIIGGSVFVCCCLAAIGGGIYFLRRYQRSYLKKRLADGKSTPNEHWE